MRIQIHLSKINFSILVGVSCLSTLNFAPALGHSQEIDPAAPEVQNCIRLGGKLVQYNVGESEALLCRFGEAGVGASSLLNYFNHQKVNSIEFLLNYTAPEATQESDLAVVPSGHKAPGGIGQFIVESNPNPSALQPGIRLVMSPRVQVSAYCRQRGGKPVQLVHSGDKTPLKACIFSDFSGIDAITLFKGPADPSNAQLVEALRSLR